MTKREKVIKGLEAHGNPESCETCAGENCPYYNEGGSFPILACSSILAADALALLNERKAKVKPQFDDDSLDRNTYIKVGDLIDCMTELSMPEDAAFHLTGAIEWACGKRAVAMPKEQEARVMTEGDVLHSTGKPMWFESRGMYLGQKGFWCLLFEVDAELHIRFVQSVTGSKITLALFDYGKLWRFWTSRPTPEQMRDTKWEVNNNG